MDSGTQLATAWQLSPSGWTPYKLCCPSTCALPLDAAFLNAAHLIAGTLIMISGSLLSLGLSRGYPLRRRLPRKWHLQPGNCKMFTSHCFETFDR